MGQNQNHKIRAVRRFLFFFIFALVIFYLVCENFPDEGFNTHWILITIYSALIGFMAFSNYKYVVMDEVVGDFKYLKRDIEKSRFKIIDERNASFILKPKFDHPYSYFNGDLVYVSHEGETAIIEGPKYYVEGLIKDIRGEMNLLTRFLSRISLFILIFIVGILPFVPSSGSEWTIKQWFHNLKIEVLAIDEIEIQDEKVLGNSLGNINNYGYSTENEDYIFYVYDHLNIVRVDKDFNNKLYLIENSDGYGIDYLNLVEDWIFYRMGGKLHRMNLDGSNNQTIYNMSHLLDVHVKGNWIYFINPEDDFKIYEMTVNGENINRFLEVEVTDIAVYGDRLYFSYPAKNEEYGYLESIGLDGSDRQLELRDTADDITIHDGYFYYIGLYNNLYRKDISNNDDAEILIDDLVFSYAITESEIFYSKLNEVQDYEASGLYRFNLDNSEVTSIYDKPFFGPINCVGNFILFDAYDSNYYQNLHRLDVSTELIDHIEP